MGSLKRTIFQPEGMSRRVLEENDAEIHNIKGIVWQNKTPQIWHQKVLSLENGGCSALLLLSFLNGLTYTFIKMINIAIWTRVTYHSQK